MKVIDNRLIVDKNEVYDLCKNCGSCCRELYFEDIIELANLFGMTKELAKGICPHSTNRGCTIYLQRPDICKKWICGVILILKGQFT